MTTEALAPGAPAAAAPAPAPAAPAAPPAPVNLGFAAPPPAAPAPEAPPAPPAKEDAKPTPATFEPTGDVGLDMALGFVGKLGFGPTHPAIAAASRGDFSIIRAELAALGPKATGYNEYIALAEKAHAEASTKAGETAAMVQEAVFAVAGGQENWQAIQQWASANADPQEKADINAMFAAGPRQAKAAAVYLTQLYTQATGTQLNPKDPAPARGRSAAPSNGALSPQEYAAEVQALSAKLRGQIDGSPEYQQLQNRRRAWQG